jgi:hypothetical protein
MRVLWVKAGGVLPADSGGRIRSLCILKELAGSIPLPSSFITLSISAINIMS